MSANLEAAAILSLTGENHTIDLPGKVFSSGSVGFFNSGKVVGGDGASYRYTFTVVREGSKREAGAEERARQVQADKAQKERERLEKQLAAVQRMQADLAARGITLAGKPGK